MYFDRAFRQKVIEITGDELTKLSYRLHPANWEVEIRIDWKSKNGKPHSFTFSRVAHISPTEQEAEQFDNYVLLRLKHEWESHQEECQQCA